MEGTRLSIGNSDGRAGAVAGVSRSTTGELGCLAKGRDLSLGVLDDGNPGDCRKNSSRSEIAVPAA